MLVRGVLSYVGGKAGNAAPNGSVVGSVWWTRVGNPRAVAGMASASWWPRLGQGCFAGSSVAQRKGASSFASSLSKKADVSPHAAASPPPHAAGAALQPQTYKQYFLSTQFWGPVANWGFGFVDMLESPDKVSLPMTGALCVYSLLFMRFAWMVQPRNMLLLACHFSNECVQQYQLFRKIRWEYYTSEEDRIVQRREWREWRQEKGLEKKK